MFNKRALQRFFALAYLFMIIAPCAWSAPIIPWVSQDSCTLGEIIELRIIVAAPQQSVIQPPDNSKDFGIFTVKSHTIDKKNENGIDSVSFKYLITAYDIDTLPLPSLPFIITHGSTIDTCFTVPIPIYIKSVITGSEHDTIRFKDIKSLLRTGNRSLFWVWIVGALCCIVLGIIFIPRLIRHLRKPPPPLPPPLPHEEAHDALYALEMKKYLEKGFLREYVFELSEIVKKYLGRRYNCHAAEFTTEEMLDWASTLPIPKDLHEYIDWFFTQTHPVKFAKNIPPLTLVEQLYRETKSFIKKTTPENNVTLHTDNGKPGETV